MKLKLQLTDLLTIRLSHNTFLYVCVPKYRSEFDLYPTCGKYFSNTFIEDNSFQGVASCSLMEVDSFLLGILLDLVEINKLNI
jgi:hypothetical protein